MRTILAFLLILSVTVHAKEVDDVLACKNADSGPPAPKVSDPYNYSAALAAWDSPKDINDWLGYYVRYDYSRAAEQENGGREPYPPLSLFNSKDPLNGNLRFGTCTDYARFAYETLKEITPFRVSDVNYLNMDLTPCRSREGGLMKGHWMVSYKVNGQFYFMADTKNPGDIAGPFPTVQAFIDQYNPGVDRKVLSWELKDNIVRSGEAPDKVYKKKSPGPIPPYVPIPDAKREVRGGGAQ